MSNRSWHRLEIGGTVDRRFLNVWLRKWFNSSLAQAERQDENHDGAPYLWETDQGKDVLIIADHECSGWSDETAELQDAGIPHNLLWDAHAGDWPAGVSYWRPGMTTPLSYECAEDEYEPMILVEKVRTMLTEATDLAALRAQFDAANPTPPVLEALVLTRPSRPPRPESASGLVS